MMHFTVSVFLLVMSFTVSGLLVEMYFTVVLLQSCRCILLLYYFRVLSTVIHFTVLVFAAR